MSAKFCNVLCYKCAWYFQATPNHLNLFLRSVYTSRVHFHVQIILHHLRIVLPHDKNFSKVKNSYIKSAYYSICDDYGVNAG